MVSFKVFLEQHTQEFYDLWKVPRAALTRADFGSWYHEVVDPRGMQGMFFGFLASWWPLRHEKNVRFFHFADMKRDLPGSIREVADFLGIAPTADQWAKIGEYASFDWMKKHESKFDTPAYTPVPVLESGAISRKGKSGTAHEDGMTDEISQHLRAAGSKIVGDEAALAWMYGGGPLP